MGGESHTGCANGERDEDFLSPRMRGVGDITQETVGPADIIGQVSSPSGGEIRREREEHLTERAENVLLTYCGTD